MRGKKRAVTGSVKWCGICGLRIPANIVSSDHPLYLTVDHIIPRDAGGKDTWTNRQAAHRWCNQRKGSRLHPLDKNLVCSIQGNIRVLFRKYGMDVYATEGQLRGARDRIGFLHPTKQQQREYPQACAWATHVWEDDGGKFFK